MHMTALRNRNLISLTAIGLLLLSVVLFLTNTNFAITVKGLSEMLFTGNHRSIQMFYYNYGSMAPAFSAMAGLFQSSSIILDPSALINANVEYFGSTAGYALSFAGTVLGSCFLMGIGYFANLLLKNRRFLEKHERALLVVLGIASFVPSSSAKAAFILSAAIGMSFRKSIAICSICQLASLIIFNII
jgi:hypothetical protein